MSNCFHRQCKLPLLEHLMTSEMDFSNQCNMKTHREKEGDTNAATPPVWVFVLA